MSKSSLTDRIRALARRGNRQALAPLLDADPGLLRAPEGGHGRSLLWEAVRHGHEDLVADLLQRGTDVDAPGRNRAEDLVLLSPLCVARSRARATIADKLLTAGARLSLYDAAWMGDLATVQAAVDEDPGCVNRTHPADQVWQVTLLHYAIAGGQEELARWLCEGGADVAAHEALLLDFAARRGSRACLALLSEHGARAAETNVFSVLSGGALDLLPWLCEQGLDVNRPVHGSPPIVYACRGDKGEHPEWAAALLDCGADVGARDSKGRTALHVAARAGSLQLVALLVERGADPAAQDRAGRTPLRLAPPKHRPSLEALLRP